MKIVVAALIVMLSVTPGRTHQPVAADFNEATMPSLISLFVTSDLRSEFVTPSIDPGTVVLLDTPVSREGARLHRESILTSGWGVVRVPLVVDEESMQQMERNHSTPLGVRGPGRSIRLISASENQLYPPASEDMHAWTVTSTWVRIRALFAG